jgi:hypothetical protein
MSCEISEFLCESGFDCVEELRGGVPVLWVEMPAEAQGQKLPGRCIVPWPVEAKTSDEAQNQAQRMAGLLMDIAKQGHKPIIITEDRWRRQKEMMQARLLAHLEVFTPMFARNCEVRKIDKETAAAFLQENHSYGDAACRYRYGLYLKRYTGKRGEISPLASLGRNDSEELGRNDSESAVGVYSGSGYVTPGTLVAVATFSNARKWQKGEKVIRSYEWTRYASLPGVRINGGMGKALKAFIKEVQPDDIMSYADLEWSEGAVYEQLGFKLEGQKAPVVFEVDGSWGRSPVKPGMTRKAGPGMTRKAGPGMTGDDTPGMTEGTSESHGRTASRYLQNFGSNKYRLKLTEYE